MKTKSLLNWLAVLASVSFFASCNFDETGPCECCTGGNDNDKLVFVDKTYFKGDSQFNLKVYTGFTPNAVKFLDSVNHDPELGRDNPDMVYNDQINERFYIDGLENFEFNTFRVFNVNPDSDLGYDTVAVWEKKNYDPASGDAFKGKGQGDKAHRTLASGAYQYQLIVDDPNVQGTPDTITSQFCIIRNPEEDNNSGLVVKEDNDPLIN